MTRTILLALGVLLCAPSALAYDLCHSPFQAACNAQMLEVTEPDPIRTYLDVDGTGSPDVCAFLWTIGHPPELQPTALAESVFQANASVQCQTAFTGAPATGCVSCTYETVCFVVDDFNDAFGIAISQSQAEFELTWSSPTPPFGGIFEGRGAAAYAWPVGGLYALDCINAGPILESETLQSLPVSYVPEPSNASGLVAAVVALATLSRRRHP